VTEFSETIKGVEVLYTQKGKTWHFRYVLPSATESTNPYVVRLGTARNLARKGIDQAMANANIEPTFLPDKTYGPPKVKA
jgi:hypothetical protein